MVGSIGGPEIVLILMVALLLFGPRRLPEIGKSIGRTLGQFRRAAADFRGDLEREIRVEKVRETEKTLQTVGKEISSEVRELGGVPDGRKEGDPSP